MVSIVIPNWNGVEKLKRNLPKVLKVNGVDEVIVVDDGSTDESVVVLEKYFPGVKLIKQKDNHGFSTSCNVGVEQSRGDYIFLLNTDAVPEVDAVEKALESFKDKKVFSVGANTGGSYSWAKWENGFLWHYQADKVSIKHQTLWSSGGSALFRKDIWQNMGGFDELFNRFYEEDFDLGYRATKRGYINLWDPNFKVEHYKEKGVIEQNFSKDFVTKIAQRNQLYVIWKNIHDKRLINEHLIALMKMLLNHPKYWGIFLSALVNLPTILRERALEKKASKILDTEILGRSY